MKRTLFAAVALCLSLHAAAAPASAESVDRLLQAMQAEKLMSSVQAQMDGIMKRGMSEALQGQALTAQKQAALDKYRASMLAIFGEEMSWPRMKGFLTQVYGESFSQEEVDGLIAFYQSPVGRAYVEKLPRVTQRTMELVQQMMGAMMPKVQAAMRTLAEDLRAADTKN